MSTKTRATIDDLYKVEGKAELVNGEIVCMSPTGGLPGKASLRIARRLLDHEESAGGGIAYPNNVAFAVKLPHRESLSPDASWYVGPPADMRFPQGAPVFAVEVRSENDYGSSCRTCYERQTRRLLRLRHSCRLGCGSAERGRD